MGCVDSLSIVTFFAIAKRMIGDGKQVAMEAVNVLACIGGTTIFEGLRKGLEILKQRRFKNPSHMSKESSVIAMPSPMYPSTSSSPFVSSSSSVSSSTSAVCVPIFPMLRANRGRELFSNQF